MAILTLAIFREELRDFRLGIKLTRGESALAKASFFLRLPLFLVFMVYIVCIIV